MYRGIKNSKSNIYVVHSNQNTRNTENESVLFVHKNL